MSSLFRTLIIVSNVAYIAWFFQPYYSTGLYTDEIRELLRSDGYSGIDYFLKYSVELGWLLLALYLIASIGMFFYIKVARTLFAVLVAASILIPLLYGVSVQSNIDVVLNTITTMAGAVILYMCFLSSLAGNFTAHNKSLNQRGAKSAPPG
jgi:hypothetical protein